MQGDELEQLRGLVQWLYHSPSPRRFELSKEAFLSPGSRWNTFRFDKGNGRGILNGWCGNKKGISSFNLTELDDKTFRAEWTRKKWEQFRELLPALESFFKTKYPGDYLHIWSSEGFESLEAPDSPTETQSETPSESPSESPQSETPSPSPVVINTPLVPTSTTRKSTPPLPSPVIRRRDSSDLLRAEQSLQSVLDFLAKERQQFLQHVKEENEKHRQQVNDIVKQLTGKKRKTQSTPSSQRKSKKSKHQ